MPFDGVGFPIDDRVSKIDQVIDLLAIPDRWCKAQFKTRDGRYCIRGAIMAVEGADFLKPMMLQAIPRGDRRTVSAHRVIQRSSVYAACSSAAGPDARPSACGQSLGSGHGRGTR